MDYEKKYRDLVEAIKKLQEANPSDEGIQYWVKDNVPELKESEDEKVRKELIKIVSKFQPEVWKELSETPQSVFIAGLEKQGEQTNPYSGISFSYNGHIWGMCARDNGVDILLDKQLFKHLENQGEQEPADKTPYPETLEKAIDLYYYSYGNGEGGFEHLSLEKFRDIVHTFVSDYGQKLAKWSEEDEKMKDAIYSCVDLHYDGLAKTSLLTWLKSLKDRYAWKPSEEQNNK